jgi:GNAT superfamily N-acetyltransferase
MPQRKALAPLIRKATAEDVESLAGLLEQLDYPTNVAEVRSRFDRLLTTSATGFLVAEGDGKVVGIASFHIFELIYRPRPQCRLTALVVRSDHRRQGIGAALVEAVEQAARERDCYRLELTTSPRRTEAIPFYAALGFTERPHRLIKVLDG